MPGTIRKGQSGLNSGCIRSLLRSSGSSLGEPKIVSRNHLLRERYSAVSGDSSSRDRLKGVRAGVLALSRHRQTMQRVCPQKGEPGLSSPFLLHRLDVLASVTIENINVRQPF